MVPSVANRCTTEAASSLLLTPWRHVKPCQRVARKAMQWGSAHHCLVSFLQATPMSRRALVCAVPPPPQAEMVDGVRDWPRCFTQTPVRSSSRAWRYLVDPASSHMLVSKIKPCMSKYECLCTVKLRMAH